jgi:hypothetical protein
MIPSEGSESPAPLSVITTPYPLGDPATDKSSTRSRNPSADALVGSIIATIQNANTTTIIRRNRISDSLPASCKHRSNNMNRRWSGGVVSAFGPSLSKPPAEVRRRLRRYFGALQDVDITPLPASHRWARHTPARPIRRGLSCWLETSLCLLGKGSAKGRLLGKAGRTAKKKCERRRRRRAERPPARAVYLNSLNGSWQSCFRRKLRNRL